MFKFLNKILKYREYEKAEKENTKIQGMDDKDSTRREPISDKLENNMENLRTSFRNSSDLIIYQFNTESGSRFFIVYLNGLVNKDILNRDVVAPLIQKFTGTNIKEYACVSNLKEATSISEVIKEVLGGNTGLFLDGYDKSFIIDSREWDKRTVDKPDNEMTIRGPKESFIESIHVNIALVRRKIKNCSLVVESLVLGKQTNTDIALAYIDGIVNRDVLAELKKRLGKIDIDSIMDTANIEQIISDNKLLPFPTVGNSEKPDIIASKILEGRIAIFCDGSPNVLTVPYLLIEAIKSGEDYYNKPIQATMLRFLRILGIIISSLLPAIFVALSTYHQEMIPSVLLSTMADAREGIPLPAFLEALIMSFVFELLKESGTRLPRAVGSAISIVGALVIGEATVNAGFTSSTMVIIISLTAVASFVSTTLNEEITINRYLFLVLAGVLGLLGIVIGIILNLTKLLSMRSFDIPYTSPIEPINPVDVKDSIIKYPILSLKMRPKSIAQKNLRRQGKMK